MWRRREILGALGTGSAGLAMAVSEAAAGDSTVEDHPKAAGWQKSCHDACSDCAEACGMAFHHCLVRASAGQPRYAKLAETVSDCAAFCRLSAAMLSRQSTMMTLSCRACADACRQCAQECESLAADRDMKTCSEACRRCEESCRNMVKAMSTHSGSTHKTG